MINLDKARALKEAGLKWEPKLGDIYRYPNGEFTGNFVVSAAVSNWDKGLWLPRLDQLMALIQSCLKINQT